MAKPQKAKVLQYTRDGCVQDFVEFSRDDGMQIITLLKRQGFKLKRAMLYKDRIIGYFLYQGGPFYLHESVLYRLRNAEEKREAHT